MRQSLNYTNKSNYYPVRSAANDDRPSRGSERLRCDWEPLRAQLLQQWNNLTPDELDEAGPIRKRVAQLIQRKYGVAAELVENYLHNFERTLPVA